MEHLVFKMHSKCLHGYQSTQLCLPCSPPAPGRQLLPKKSEPKQRQEASATRRLASPQDTCTVSYCNLLVHQWIKVLTGQSLLQSPNSDHCLLWRPSFPFISL